MSARMLELRRPAILNRCPPTTRNLSKTPAVESRRGLKDHTPAVVACAGEGARLNSPTEVYVDTNGFSDLFRRDSPEERDVRGRLQASARGGTYRYLTSGWTIEELAGLAEHNSEKFHRVVQFVFELVGENLIDDTMTLLEREIRSGRPVEGDERMLPRDQLTSLRETWADSETARRISQDVRGENRQNKAEFEAARQVL